jgi:hypothetical protein
MSEDARCADRFLCVPLATVTKPISDLRLLISDLFPLPFALSLVGAMLFALCVPASAQQAAKIPRVGELLFRPGPALGAGRELFRRSLRELGYTEGKNIAFEIRSAEGKLDRFPALADELADSKLMYSSPPRRMRPKRSETLPERFLSYFWPTLSPCSLA